ncbi:hypothetical protein EYF80_025935 [Liparis tanakae]|uniref:Uncharacterized protein n=1 Tax=Liparis tanakae TaxID=230148 RepID=A0A4Z2HDT7_9TELE|nr:hypothetical protein EYF80_025935 [Liparis tanakae]
MAASSFPSRPVTKRRLVVTRPAGPTQTFCNRSACLCACSTISSCSSIRRCVSRCFSTSLSSWRRRKEENNERPSHPDRSRVGRTLGTRTRCYLHHGLLVDVLLEGVGLALDGVPLQRLQDGLRRHKAVFGLQQGHVRLLGPQHGDHLVSGLRRGKHRGFGLDSTLRDLQQDQVPGPGETFSISIGL